MPNLYRTESSDPKTNAQRNLSGRTHYVDDDTLRWHHSRVLSAKAIGRGFLFAIVTSDALDMHNRKRGFRYVVFDIFGTVIARVELKDAFSSQQKAAEAMWKWLNDCDAKAITRAGIEAATQHFTREMIELRDIVSKQWGEAA